MKKLILVTFLAFIGLSAAWGQTPNSGGMVPSAPMWLTASSIPANAWVQLITPSGAPYIDNTFRMQNNSYSTGTGINYVTSIVGGTGGTPGVYRNVALTNGSGSNAKANITVGAGGNVTKVDVTQSGTGYTLSDTNISAASGNIGGATGFSCTVAALIGTLGNNAISLDSLNPDGTTSPFWRGAVGAGPIQGQSTFARKIFLEFGNGQNDTYDYGLALVRDYTGSVQYRAVDIDGTTGNITFNNTSNVPLANFLLSSGFFGIGNNIVPVNLLDVKGGAAIGSDAGVNTAPTNGLIVSGNVGVGTAANAPLQKLDVRGKIFVSPAGDTSANIGKAISVDANVATDAISFTQAGVGTTFLSNSGAAVLGSDGSQSIKFKTGITGNDPSTGTAQLTLSTTTATFANQINVTGMTQTSAAQTGTICYNSGTGAITYDATLGCLTSSARFKTDIFGINSSDALKTVAQLQPVSFRKKEEFGGNVDKDVQVGFVAEDVAEIDERLTARGEDGEVRGVRYQQMTAILAGAIKELKSENDSLRACNDNWKCRIFGIR